MERRLKNRLLAKSSLSSLTQSQLDTLTKAQHQDGWTSNVIRTEFLQSHNTLNGSFNERMEKVATAFRVWARDARDILGSDEYDYYYWWSCTILGVYESNLVFYVYCDGAPIYHRVDYTVDASGNVQIGGTIEPVDVTMVVKELGVAQDDATQSVEPTDLILATETDDVALQSVAWQYASRWPEAARKEANKEDFGNPDTLEFPIKTQGDLNDAIRLVVKATDPTATTKRLQAIATRKGLSIPATKETNMKTQGDSQVIKDEALSTSKTIEHSDDSPVVPTPKEDANTPGSTVGITPADIASAPVEHSDDSPAGKSDENSPTGDVKNELNDKAAGYKGSDPAHGYGDIDKPFNQATGQGNPKFLIQSKNNDHSGKSLSYVEQTKKTNEGKTLNLQGIATRADIVNAEGYVYPLAVWEQNVKSLNEMCQGGKCIGKLEHPDKELGLQDVALKFNSFSLKGSDVYFDADVVQTAIGKDLAAIIDSGIQVDMSTRGYGTAKDQNWHGQSVKMIQDDFVCVGVDAVWYGASTGSGVTDVQYQSANPNATDNEMETLTQSQKDARDLRSKVEFTQYKSDLLQTCGLSEVGKTAFSKALDNATDLDSAVTIKNTMLPILQSTFAANTGEAEQLTQSATWTPKFLVQSTKEESAPKSIDEMFNRMVSDLPDHYEGVTQTQSAPENHFRSPRSAVKHQLVEMTKLRCQGFNGLAAAKALVYMEQGNYNRAEDTLLTQALAPGATTTGGDADPGGAPLSAPLIFPLVRRVFPMYIMNELAAIQPMDRPEGKIFYLDQYRTNSSSGANVARIDLNTSSSPFNSSYANNSTEGSAAQLIRLQLASITVSANTKKLGANWSIEEMQDLRAYHGLDAGQELLQGVARELAIEWNSTVLNDMAAQATAASLTFGTTIPDTGFQQQSDWDQYIWVYLQKLDNAIFAKRNGPMTHVVCGIDAAMAMAKSMRGTFEIGGDNGGDMGEMYPGTTFFGTVRTPNGSKYRIFKTNFWGSGTQFGNTILGLRRGQEWSDTPYVWAPYTDYVTPMLTDPGDFSQKQGIVSRAANQVVVSDAMGLINVVPGQKGAVL